MLMGELLPVRERATVASVVTAVNNCAAFIVIVTFHVLAQLLRNGNVFILYSTLSLCAAVFTAVLVPETNGASLEARTHSHSRPSGVRQHLQDVNLAFPIPPHRQHAWADEC